MNTAENHNISLLEAIWIIYGLVRGGDLSESPPTGYLPSIGRVVFRSSTSILPLYLLNG